MIIRSHLARGLTTHKFQWSRMLPDRTNSPKAYKINKTCQLSFLKDFATFCNVYKHRAIERVLLSQVLSGSKDLANTLANLFLPHDNSRNVLNTNNFATMVTVPSLSTTASYKNFIEESRVAKFLTASQYLSLMRVRLNAIAVINNGDAGV